MYRKQRAPVTDVAAKSRRRTAGCGGVRSRRWYKSFWWRPGGGREQTEILNGRNSGPLRQIITIVVCPRGLYNVCAGRTRYRYEGDGGGGGICLIRRSPLHLKNNPFSPPYAFVIGHGYTEVPAPHPTQSYAADPVCTL